MSETKSQNCPSCGAQNAPDNTRCDLCGAPLTNTEGSDEKRAIDEKETGAKANDERANDKISSDEMTSDESSSSSSSGAAEETSDGVYCHQCGWESPPGARFCSQCGTRLQSGKPAAKPAAKPATQPGRKPAATSRDEPALPPPVASASSTEAGGDGAESGESEGGLGRQVAMIVGIGVLLVLGLFLISIYSNQMQQSGTATSSQAAGPNASTQTPAGAAGAQISPQEVRRQTREAPLEENLQRRVDAILSEAEALEGDAAYEKRAELVDLFIGFGHRGRAALAQEAIARDRQTFASWRSAGNLLYDWMRGEQGATRSAIASMAAQAYEEALRLGPDDPNVRTDLATAYLETNNPMRGVQQVKQVLADNPDHVKARFNYGIMLLRIQRLEQALEQFEHVRRLAEDGSQAHQQATELISLVREQMST